MPTRPMTHTHMTATIDSGSSLSDAVNLKGYILTGIYMPAAWTAASVTFEASHDGSSWYDLYYEGTEVSTTADADQYISMQSDKFFGAHHIKVRSGTAAAGVNQGADRTIRLAVGNPVS